VRPAKTSYPSSSSGASRRVASARALKLLLSIHRLMQTPFCFIHPSKLAWLFNAKAILVPIVAVGE
jgi:hypothetical protein